METTSKIFPGHAVLTATKIAANTYRRKQNLFIAWALFFLVIFAGLISLRFLLRQSLRLDEAQSLWQISGSPVSILNIVAQDVHVPLYHLLLHFWVLLFGNGVPAARSFSLLFFLVSIPALFKLGRLVYSKPVALFAAALYSVSPFINWYANEIRMYSLLTFITILNQYFFLQAYKKNTTASWVLYALTAVLGSFTHYFFLMILATQAVFYFFYKKLFKPKAFVKLFFTALIIVLGLTPWVLYVAKLGLASTTQPALSKPTTVDLFDTFAQFLFGFQNDRLNTILVSLWPVAVVLGFLSLRKNKKLSPESFYFFLSFLVPVLGAFVLSLTLKPIFLSRYLIICVPSMYLFLSWIISTYPFKVARVLQIILIFGLTFSLILETVSASTPVKEDYLQAVEYLTPKATPQDIIVVSAPFTIYPLEYYYHGPARIATLPIWDQFSHGKIPSFSESSLPQEVDELKGDHQRVFLILSYNQGYEDKIRLYFDNHFERLDEKNFSPGLNLYVYRLRYP